MTISLNSGAFVACHPGYLRIRAFSVDVPLRALFERPTIAGLAADSETGRRERSAGTAGRGLSTSPIIRTGEAVVLGSAGSNNPFYNIYTALRLEGQLNIEVLSQVLSEIAC
jgi:hypothetical protein